MSGIEHAIQNLDTVLNGLHKALAEKKELGLKSVTQQDLFAAREQNNQPQKKGESDGLSKEKTQALAKCLDRMIEGMETLLTEELDEERRKEAANG